MPLEPVPFKLLIDIKLGRRLCPPGAVEGVYLAIEARLTEPAAEGLQAEGPVDPEGTQRVAIELTDCTEDVVPDLDRGKERKGGGSDGVRVGLSDGGMARRWVRRCMAVRADQGACISDMLHGPVPWDDLMIGASVRHHQMSVHNKCCLGEPAVSSIGQLRRVRIRKYASDQPVQVYSRSTIPTFQNAR